MGSVYIKNEGRTTVYPIRDAGGKLIAKHHRVDAPDGDKAVWWEREGEKGLQGLRLQDLPLYGSEHVSTWPEDELIVLVEGEKVRDHLGRTDFFYALGTACGASVTPGREALEVLRDRRVVLSPDNDDAGRRHMEKIAEALQGIAAEVLVYECDEAPEKSDLADHPAILEGDRSDFDRLLTELESAPRWRPKKPRGLQGRVLLGKGIAGELEPPDELEPGILLRGKVHSVYAGPGTGKTMFAAWAVKRCLDRGQAVVVLDMENGPRILSERLRGLGVDDERADELLHYFPSPNLPLTAEARAAYEALLDDVRPALVVFDSLINFLASAGMDENSSNDVARWAVAYTHPARDRGITVLLLDHVPHEGSHARGSTRKKDEVDVMWRLHNTQPFDRDSVGEIVLHREKDREAWLPPSARFSVGGGSEGFVFKRSAGTIEETAEGELTERQKQALDALRTFGVNGARYAEWKRASGLRGTTFDRAISALTVRNLVRKAEGIYHPRTQPPGGGPGGGSTSAATPTTAPAREGGESGLFKGDSEDPHEPPPNPHGQNGGGEGHYPRHPRRLIGGGGGGSFVVGSDLSGEEYGFTPREGSRLQLSVEEVVAEMRRPNSGPRLNLPLYLVGDTSLEILTKSVLVAMNLDPAVWEELADVVEEAVNNPANHPLDCECEACL